MSWYLLAAYAHVVTAVLFVGYALFWVVMASGLQGEAGKEESRTLLRAVRDARWPPAAVPEAVRLAMPGLGWVFLAVLLATGVAVLDLRGLTLAQILSAPGPFAATLRIKIVLVGVLAVVQLAVTMRPAPWVAYLHGGVTLGVLVSSALLRH